ncbi:MAG: LCP family protein [Clostridiaceae bacterium]
MNDNIQKRSLKNKPKKSRKGMASILIILAVLLIIAAAGIGYAYYLTKQVDTVKIDESTLDVSSQVESQYKGIQNIAIFGIDSTDGTTGRSDSIMILTIDNTRNNMRISSIMRDSYVAIKGYGNDKLTHAYAYGGPELAISTLNTNYDLNIKDFVAVNFTNLPKIVDYLGGIDMNMTSLDVKYINEHIDNLNYLNSTSVSHVTKTGLQHLNGTQTLAYLRIRYVAGDQERTQRNRTVLEALLNKIKATNKTQYPAILQQLLPLVTTSLASTEIVKLATTATSFGTMEQDRFPRDDNAKDQMINGVYYMGFNKELTVEQMHKFIFEDTK